MTKTTYILANINKAIAFEWIVEHMNQQQIQLSFIILNPNDSYLYNWLQKKGIECYLIPHHGKKSYPASFFKVVRLLKKIKPTIVHTHLFDANLIGLSAAKLVGIKKRIYTRHHSTYHHQYFPKAVKWDKLTNRLATDIVAISKNVNQILVQQENVKAQKTHLIHHGFDLEKFNQVSESQINEIKEKYQLTNNNPVIGVISRFIQLKGIQYIIPAFKQLLTNYPNAKLVLANANGPDKDLIQKQLREELSPNQYIEIAFEPDLFSLYQLFDIYIHVPVNSHIEAFGQTYVEALAAGTPSIFTLSGVANEFIQHQQNAWVVDYKNTNAIYEAMTILLEDKSLSLKLAQNGINSVQPFNLATFIQKLEQLYV